GARAPPAPVRGVERAAAAARGRRPRRVRRVRAARPRRGDRAAAAPVLRREPVPPGVQVTTDASVAAVPRLRRRRRRAAPHARRQRGRTCGMTTAAAPEALAFFLELARLVTPSGRERATADSCAAYLLELGIEVVEDNAGAKIDGDTGNVYARLE